MSNLVGNPNCWFSHAKAHCNKYLALTSRILLVMFKQYVKSNIKKIKAKAMVLEKKQ